MTHPPVTVRRPPGAVTIEEAAARPWDVVVLGGGNAALVSALAAHDAGASVVVVERADPIFRGGNSRHTRNIRCVHQRADAYNTGAYTYDELWKDLCSVGSGPSNEELAALTVRKSEEAPPWMSQHGILWQPPLHGTLHLGRTNRFFLGGGKALVNAYHRTLVKVGIPVVYETTAVKLDVDGDRCTGVVVGHAGSQYRLTGRSIICASGGFEANIEWLSRYWGDAAQNYHIRGPRFNDGLVLRELLDHGAASAGEEKGFHSVAVDARSPKFDGGIATRLDSIPFGIVLNKYGERFYDEGEDLWPKRYAIWGRNIAQQDDQIAYLMWDDTVNERFLPPMFGAYRADTVEELARMVGVPADTAAATVRRYNAAVPADSRQRFDPTLLDGVCTSGITPAKTNWAQPLDKAPFRAVVARPGITFTYLGVAVDSSARVQRQEGRFSNVFAAGEIMSGNILSSGYMAGFGLTIGTVWGRIAGEEAARHAAV